jgi:transposase
MGVKRKQHSGQFKAQVAMAALSGDKTLAELSSQYGVHQTMISTWKQELMRRAGELFERGNRQGVATGQCVSAGAASGRRLRGRFRWGSVHPKVIPPPFSLGCYRAEGRGQDDLP